MPGVLLCEAIYQTGALLMSKMNFNDSSGFPVVTRTNNLKYKSVVKPLDELIIEVEFLEKFSSAYSFKGKIKVNEKTAVSCDFMCTLLKEV